MSEKPWQRLVDAGFTDEQGKAIDSMIHLLSRQLDERHIAAGKLVDVGLPAQQVKALMEGCAAIIVDKMMRSF